MEYSISEAAKATKISAHTLRFYEKSGLLPWISRDEVGNRIFRERDLQWLSLVECFKQTGMSLKEIRDYLALCERGDSTLRERLEIMKAHKKHMLGELAKIKEYMKKIDFKLRYYETAISAGSEAVAQKILAADCDCGKKKKK